MGTMLITIIIMTMMMTMMPVAVTCVVWPAELARIPAAIVRFFKKVRWVGGWRAKREKLLQKPVHL